MINIKINGINKEISISKIKKIKLIKKNWILKGIRVLLIGSKPHSNADNFSRLLNIFFEIKKLIKIIIEEIKNNIVKIKKIIIYINKF